MRDDVGSLARAYLQECFERQSAPRVSELAARLGVSRSQLNEYFRCAHDMTASAFLKNEQIEEAKRLLRETGLTLAEIAYRAGFGTRRTLYRAFLRVTGMTPDQYRRACQNVSRPADG